jgi:hypothetical protein
LQTTFAADAHLAEGQFLLEEQTLNIAKSLIYRAGIIIIIIIIILKGPVRHSRRLNIFVSKHVGV